MKDPFFVRRFADVDSSWIDADSRIEAVKNFSAQQCRDALKLSDLQKTVRLAIERRLRQLAKGGA